MLWGIRRSTALLIAVFLTTLVLYFLVRPPRETPGPSTLAGVRPAVGAPLNTLAVPSTTVPPTTTVVEMPTTSTEPLDSTTTATPVPSTTTITRAQTTTTLRGWGP